MPAPKVPQHTKGKKADLECNHVFSSGEEAATAFEIAAKKLRKPQEWHTLAGTLSASFKLTDASGKHLDSEAVEGNYIRIDIPGPGSTEGDGYDWVKVRKIEQAAETEAGKQSVAMTVEAATNPTTPGDDTAHFFEAGATSTFMIKRLAHNLIASYHGRNEVPNTDVNKATDKIRNVLVASGALAGLSEVQWTALLKGFLSESRSIPR